MENKKFSLKARIKSFGYALRGMLTLVQNEHNARIHLFVTIFVIIAGFLLEVSSGEWIAIIFAIGFVFAMEAVNSAVEYLSDLISPDYNDLIKQAKDVAAAAVLFAAIAAVCVGLIIFIPKILNLCQSLSFL